MGAREHTGERPWRRQTRKHGFSGLPAWVGRCLHPRREVDSLARSSRRPRPRGGGRMSGYAVAQIDEIDEISDGRCPWRPVRHPLRHHGLRGQRVYGP